MSEEQKSLSVRLDSSLSDSMWSEQLRHVARKRRSTTKDVNASKLTSLVMKWFFAQGEDVRDNILGDVFAKTEAPVA